MTTLVLLVASACSDSAPPIDAAPRDAGEASSDAASDAPNDDAGSPIRVCSIRIGADGMVDDTCDDDLICICPDNAPECTDTGRCHVAFGLRYLVGIASADAPRRRADGECWDPDCSAPDPYARLLMDEELVGMTPALANVTLARWDPPVTFFVTAQLGTVFRLEVWDADDPVDELVLSCGRAVTSAYVLRRRVLSCSDALGTIGAAILPMPD